MTKLFKTFKFKGIQFLALESTSNTVHIIDDDGYNYGGYYSIDSFKDFVQKDNSYLNAIGKIRLNVWIETINCP